MNIKREEREVHNEKKVRFDTLEYHLILIRFLFHAKKQNKKNLVAHIVRGN